MALAPKKTAKKKKAARTVGAPVNFLKQLDPRVRRWLNTPDPDDLDEDEEDPTDEIYERWLLKCMANNRILDVGGVMVDKSLLEGRFACVPEYCSPEVDRGKSRSCCADLTVYLVPAERNRLGKHRVALREHLLKREPRLAKTLKKKRGKVTRFFLDEDGDALCRPGKRCVFSKIDSRGRIRCHLHQIHRSLGIEQTDLQPVTCRLFPLVLVHMPRGKVLVTMINRENYRCWGGKHPRFFPCMTRTDLPPVLTSMGPTLDWMFGKGFVKAIRQAGRES